MGGCDDTAGEREMIVISLMGEENRSRKIEEYTGRY